MRPAILLTVGLLSAALIAGACASGTKSTERSAGFAPAIEALNSKLEERFRAADMLGVADLYADDGLLIERETRIEGREAIDAYWSKMSNPVRWRLESFEIGGSEELAYQLGRSHLTRQREGLEHTTVVEFMRLWEKDAEGEWKIAVDASW